MKITSIFLLTLVFMLGCNSADLEKKETELKQKELDLRQREIALQEQQNNTVQIKKHEQEAIEQAHSKYMYIVIKTNEPKIESEKIELPPEPILKSEPNILAGLIPDEVPAHFLRDPVYIKHAVPQYFTYKSEIVEISNYSEDLRYIAIDKYQSQVNLSLAAANRNIQFENSYKPGSSINAEAKITSKESYLFDSYKEASLHKDANN